MLVSTDPYVGEICMFAGNFPPRGWAFCNGQIMAISQNPALFSLLGTRYGGDGDLTFALPDLRGAMPIGQGQGPGLDNYLMGQTSGNETHSMIAAELPTHTHTMTGVTELGTTPIPTGAYPANTGNFDKDYRTSGTPTTMHPGTLGVTGSSSPIDVMQPYLTINFIICTQGVFPSRQ